MNNLMSGLVAGVALILLYLGWLAMRNPVLVKIGVRNIPRRPAQSILIVSGLTLSTVIILSALAIGDTLTYSVRSHAVQAYGKIDEIIAPPLVSQLVAVMNESDTEQEATVADEQIETLERLGEGGLTSVLAAIEGGLPGITEERYMALRRAAQEDPLIDAVSSSIIFPTLIRNVNTGQGEPLGFIFAVDDNYDTQFGLTAIDGMPVEMESLQTGVGNIFAQAAALFSLVEQAGSQMGSGAVQISDVAVATAAVGAALTGSAGESFDLTKLSIDVATLRELGVDTALLEERGINSLSLASPGLDESGLQAFGVTTTTMGLETFGIDDPTVQGMKDQFLRALNVNTLGSEIDRALAQAGLQLRQGDVYLNRLGAERLDARVGDVLDVYIGPLPIPFRVKAIVDEAGPLSALTPVVMLRLDEAQKLLFMKGRVNNVLISNLGDELGGIEHTDAVSERLRVLAMDPDLVEEAAAILRRPDVLSVVAAEAQQVEDEFDVPPFLASLAGDVVQIASFAASAKSMAAALADLPTSPTDPVDNRLRKALAKPAVRIWLLDLPLASQDRNDLRTVLAQINQFDVLDPLNKATLLAVADIGGMVFSSLFSVFGVFSILAGILLIVLIFVMLAAERRSEMGIARAIGVQRSHLVQTFVTEGVLYDLAAAALGVALGMWAVKPYAYPLPGRPSIGCHRLLRRSALHTCGREHGLVACQQVEHRLGDSRPAGKAVS